MKLRPKRPRRANTKNAALASAVTAGLLTAAACSYDFHAFDPILGEGPIDASLDRALLDTNPSPDAGVDSGVSSCAAPAPKCLSEAVECGRASTDDENKCLGNCGILSPPQCKAACEDAGITRRKNCRATCNGCTADAGCEDPIRCAEAVDGRDS